MLSSRNRVSVKETSEVAEGTIIEPFVPAIEFPVSFCSESSVMSIFIFQKHVCMFRL